MTINSILAAIVLSAVFGTISTLIPNDWWYLLGFFAGLVTKTLVDIFNK